MSIHSSLKATHTMKRHRSVLSRLERVKQLGEQGLLDPETASFVGLPKVKHLRIKMRKEKAAAAVSSETGAPLGGAGAAPSKTPPTGGAAPKPAAKGAPQAKPAAAAPAKAAGPSAGKTPSTAPSKKKE